MSLYHTSRRNKKRDSALILIEEMVYQVYSLTPRIILDIMQQNQVHFKAEITIQEGKIEEFKKLVQVMSRMVEANEPDTINYQFYLNRSEQMCIAHEIYANSEAALAHINGVASQTILPKIFSVSRNYMVS